MRKRLSSVQYNMLRAWVKKKHGRFTSATYKRYWIRNEKRKTFGYWETAEEGLKKKLITLKTHAEIYRGYSIVKYVKMRSAYSVFDGNAEYWSKRALAGRETKTRLSLLCSQNYKCAICEIKLRPTDTLEVDHIKPSSEGGSNKITNLRLVHAHCHDQKRV